MDNLQDKGEHFEWPLCKLDLNLLVIFDTVMQERHVTRASKRLGLTQSAVSNALNRLRKIYEDVLFVKTPKGVEPTKYAFVLWQEVHASIGKLQRTIKPENFNPATTNLEFRVSMTDLAAVLLSAHLSDHMQATAPKASLSLATYVPDFTNELLVRGDVDFTICVNPPRMTILESMPLWCDEFVLAGRRDHPKLSQPLTLDELCEQRFLAVNLYGTSEYISRVDQSLADMGRSRKVVLTVNQFLVANTILCDSDLLAVLPKRLLTKSYCGSMLAYQPLPFKISDLTFHLAWHKRLNSLQSMEWFKQRVIEAVIAMNSEEYPLKEHALA